MCRQHPLACAVESMGEEPLSYAQLETYARSIGAALKEHGAAKEKTVAICLEKGSSYIAAFLGVWFAGAAFMPVDAKLPVDRINLMLTESECLLVLTQPEFQYLFRLSGAECLLISDLIEQRGALDPPCMAAEDLAYSIYTSGSTGQPKGVLVTHRGIVSFIDCQIRAFGLAFGKRALFYLSTSFDASVSDMGTALLSGATLVIDADCTMTPPGEFLVLCERHRITHMDIPPALLRMLDPQEAPACLESIVIGGEAVSPEVVRKWSSRCRVVNVYGPTEATVCTSLVICDGQTWDAPLIGQPVDGMHYLVLDENGEEVGLGSHGELFIGGLGVARGYLKRPQLNQVKFIIRGGERLYRTGDLVRRTESGEYEFLGRCDRQFKLRGLLVEPEEIETRLAEIDGVERASVLKLSAGRRDCLVAFLQTREEGAPSPAVLRQGLSRTLPAWMLPQRFVYRQELPLTTTGKVNLEALRQIWEIVAPSKVVAKDEAPSCSEAAEQKGLVETLRGIWSQVLSLPATAVGLEDDFFDLGGDSFSVLEIVVAAEARGIVLPPEMLFRERTIARLSAALNESSQEELLADTAMSADFLRQRVTELVREFQHQKSSTRAGKSGKITEALVTGATGFLGSRLLVELLADSELELVCLVRAGSRDEGISRLRKAAARHGKTLSPDDEERIEILCGDVSLNRLGLSEEQWHSLSQRVGTIYHNAAQVNMLTDYYELEPVNTKSSLDIFSLMQAGCPKSLHYASTLSVFVATDRNSGRLVETDDLSSTKEVFGGYAQSKWAGELLTRRLANGNDSVSIYRLGLLTADASGGKAADNDFLEMFVRGIGELGCVPDTEGDIAIDITPVDFCARAMSRISTRQNSREGVNTFHIANPQSLKLSSLFEWIKLEDKQVRTVSLEQFRRIVAQKAHSSTEAAAASLALCRLTGDNDYFRSRRSMDLFQATDVVFDMKNTTKVLADEDISCPPPDASLIRRYVRAALNS